MTNSTLLNCTIATGMLAEGAVFRALGCSSASMYCWFVAGTLFVFALFAAAFPRKRSQPRGPS